MSTPLLSDHLRHLLDIHMFRDARDLKFVSKYSTVVYWKLWRFYKMDKSLSVDDANKLHIYLTGSQLASENA